MDGLGLLGQVNWQGWGEGAVRGAIIGGAVGLVLALVVAGIRALSRKDKGDKDNP